LVNQKRTRCYWQAVWQGRSPRISSRVLPGEFSQRARCLKQK